MPSEELKSKGHVDIASYGINREVVGESVIFDTDNLVIDNDMSLRFRLVTAVEFEERDLRAVNELIPKILGVMARRNNKGPWSIMVLDGSKGETGHEHFQLSLSQGEVDKGIGETRLEIDYSQSYPETEEDDTSGRVLEEGVITVVVEANKEKEPVNEIGTTMTIAALYLAKIGEEYGEYKVEDIPKARIQEPETRLIKWDKVNPTTNQDDPEQNQP